MLKIALTCSFNDGNYFIKPRYPQYLTEAAERYGYDIMPVVLPITDKSDVTERYAREFDGFCSPAETMFTLRYTVKKSSTAAVMWKQNATNTK